MRKVLFVANNHPSIRPGGLQVYADELYHAMREGGRFEPLYVSRRGLPHSSDEPHDGTRFAIGEGDPSLYYFHTKPAEFSQFLWTARDKRLYTEDWRSFLLAHRPDVVHFHHILYLGYDIIRETRRTLPNAALVYTVHDLAPICQHAGQMVRTHSFDLCDRASPQRCHECFPQVAPQEFFLRERFIKSTLELVDMFIAPSADARTRCIEWGIREEKIRHENYGRILTPALPDPPEAGRRRTIGYIGRMTRFKGVDLLLEAVRTLLEQGVEIRLMMWGANLEIMPRPFQDRIRGLLAETSDSVVFAGAYDYARLPTLLSAVDWVVVPSIWWETGPLVIQEAMMHRRPVICSNVGAMIERVEDGINGLHFHVGDRDSLAATIKRAVDSPELWDELRSNLTDPYPMDEHLRVLSDLYDELLTQRANSHGMDSDAEHPPAAALR